MSASARRVAGLVAALALSAVVAVGCDSGGNNNRGGNSGGGNNSGVGGISPNTSSCTSPGKTVTVGGLTWMAENLNCDASNSWCYGDDNSNCTKYGRLYTWEAAKTACPSDWRLPDTADWRRLVEVAGGSSIAGRKLKSKTGWQAIRGISSTDEFGFSALPGGYRNADGSFDFGGNFGLWWSATESGSGNAWNRYMSYGHNDVYENYDNEGYGFSVRCVR